LVLMVVNILLLLLLLLYILIKSDLTTLPLFVLFGLQPSSLSYTKKYLRITKYNIIKKSAITVTSVPDSSDFEPFCLRLRFLEPYKKKTLFYILRYLQGIIIPLYISEHTINNIHYVCDFL